MGFYFAILFFAALANTRPVLAAPFDVDSLISLAREQKLSDDPQWRMMGYYEEGFFGVSSRASPSFFLAPNGEHDPEAELEATIRALFSAEERNYQVPSRTSVEKQIPRCQFPLRTRWLARKLGFEPKSLPQIECGDLAKFRIRMGGKSASVVFSSFFMNSPSSSFGHSLLRVSQEGGDVPSDQRLELLDFGFGFAADANTSNPVVYAFNGIAGLFRGTYSNIPYYYKVREYNDFESRDLWSYELNLSDEERAMLVDRIWELGSTDHRYFYFTFNCSNAILHAVETVAPRYRILSELKYYVIPSDTIKALTRVPGLVKRVTYRPSAYSVFQRRIKAMSASVVDELARMIDSGFSAETISRIPSSSRIDVLDASADYIDYKYSKEIDDRESPASAWRQNVLVARAQTSGKSRSFAEELPESGRPDQGHSSLKLSIAGGQEGAVGNYGQLNARFALHDVLDPARGYPANSQIEMIGLKLRKFESRGGIEIEDLNFFRVMTLSPLSRFDRNKSWRGEFGGKRVRDKNCDRCFATVGEFALGYAVEPVPSLVAFAMADFGIRHAPSFAGSNLQLGLGPSVGVLATAGPLGLLATARYRREFFAAYPNTREYAGQVRYNLSPSLSLGIEARRYDTGRDVGFYAGAFF